MDIVPVPVGSLHASSRCEHRSHRIGRVKFIGLPLEMQPGEALRGQPSPGNGVARFISRVIGCLVAARP
jgi:hypothetical protein